MHIKQQESSKEQDNILPLVNIVFLLLIFFMLAGAYSTPDAFQVSVPIAENEKSADRKVLTVLMNAEGEIALDNAIISIEELNEIIEDRVQNNSLEQLQLKADANMHATKLVDVMDVLHSTGLEALHLLTETAESN